MTRILLTCLALSATPASAHDWRAQINELLDQLDGYTDTTRDTLKGFLDLMGPELDRLGEAITDWSAYHPPEVLENGDIIIRRKTPPPKAPEPGIEL